MAVVPFERFKDCFNHPLAFRIKNEEYTPEWVLERSLFGWAVGTSRRPVEGTLFKHIYVNKWTKAPDQSLYIDQCSSFSYNNKKTPLYYTVLLHSPMGTGKTEFMIHQIETIRKYKQVLFPTNWKVVYISQRRSLAQETQTRFEKKLNFKFNKYDELKSNDEIRSSEYLIIQADSVNRLADRFGVMPTVPLLILDEISSLLEHVIDSKTLSDNNRRYKVMINLEQIISKANYVILADAYPTEAVFQIPQFLRKRSQDGKIIPFFYYDSDLKPNKDCHACIKTLDWEDKCINHICRKYQMVADEFFFINEVKKSLKDQKKIVITFSHATEAMQYYSMIKREFPDIPQEKIHCYTAQTEDEPSNMELKNIALRDVNGELGWKNLQVLLYSPKISTGISFDISHFDKIFGFFRRGSVNARGFCQQLGRIRNSPEECLICCPDNIKNNPLPITLEDINNEKEFKKAFLTILGENTFQYFSQINLLTGTSYFDWSIIKDIPKFWKAIWQYNQIEKNMTINTPFDTLYQCLSEYYDVVIGDKPLNYEDRHLPRYNRAFFSSVSHMKEVNQFHRDCDRYEKSIKPNKSYHLRQSLIEEFLLPLNSQLSQIIDESQDGNTDIISPQPPKKRHKPNLKTLEVTTMKVSLEKIYGFRKEQKLDDKMFLFLSDPKTADRFDKIEKYLSVTEHRTKDIFDKLRNRDLVVIDQDVNQHLAIAFTHFLVPILNTTGDTISGTSSSIVFYKALLDTFNMKDETLLARWERFTTQHQSDWNWIKDFANALINKDVKEPKEYSTANDIYELMKVIMKKTIGLSFKKTYKKENNIKYFYFTWDNQSKILIELLMRKYDVIITNIDNYNKFINFY